MPYAIEANPTIQYIGALKTVFVDRSIVEGILAASLDFENQTLASRVDEPVLTDPCSVVGCR